jgi:hypothetical protein
VRCSFGLIVTAELRGWTPMRPTEVKNTTPRSIRDNPGAYRPHYRSYIGGTYMRGK